jgi:amino acid transporter
MDEKQAIDAEKAPPTAPTFASDGEATEQWRDTEDFMTRNGLNLKSFQRRPINKNVELDKSMKTRHLHMIAIGGSIGAGFFVGSGSALFKGVSYTAQTPSLSRVSRLHRTGSRIALP